MLIFIFVMSHNELQSRLSTLTLINISIVKRKTKQASSFSMPHFFHFTFIDVSDTVFVIDKRPLLNGPIFLVITLFIQKYNNRLYNFYYDQKKLSSRFCANKSQSELIRQLFLANEINAVIMLGH